MPTVLSHPFLFATAPPFVFRSCTRLIPHTPPSCHLRQILFLSGVATTIGPVASWRFFTKRRNYKGTGAFAFGFLLVLVRWPITGMASQFYGMLLLFADFLPTALPLARRMPVLGYVLSLPPVKAATSRLLSLTKNRGTERLPA